MRTSAGQQSPVAGDDDLRLYLLVLRCQAGDERAFTSLLDEFGQRTLTHLRSLVGDDAEDVQQEVWLTVYRNLRNLGNPRAFRTWLFRTTRHRAIDFLRARRRERELVDDVAQDAPLTVEPDDPVAGDRLAESTLGGALTGLPLPQREVLVLRYQEDMSYAEIAVLMGTSVGTVRSRLHHAKRRLQEQIDGHPAEGETP